MDKIVIQIDTNAAEAGKTFDQLNQKFKETDTGAKDLRKEIKELKAELFKLTPGTEEYAQALQQLGGKMNQLSDTTQELRVATGGLDTVFQTTTQATATMAGGFTAVTGVMALFGSDTEDLQKTFVKLQAVMAITTGLKGFAAFEKMTKRASISLKAYIAQMKLSRTATQQQSAANVTLTTTTNAASTATKGLGAAIKSVTAAIASNPIGAVLVALTAAITAISSFNSKAKEAEEQTRRWNDVLNELKGSQYTYSSLLEQEEAYFNKDIAAMKALGASQESINKKTLEYSKARKEELVTEREYLQNLIERNKENKELNEKLEKWADRVREINAEVKGLDETIQTLSYHLPAFAANFDQAFADLDRDLSRKVSQGVMTERQKVTEEVNFYQNELQTLRTTIDKYRKELGDAPVEMDENGRNIYQPNTSLTAQQKKQMQEDIRDMEARVQLYEGQIAIFTKTIEDIDDRNAKALRDKRMSNLKSSQEELERLAKELEKKWETISKEITETVNARDLLNDAIGNDTMPRSFSVLIELKHKFEKELGELQLHAKENNKLLEGEYRAYVNMILKYNEKIDQMFRENDMDYKDWPVNITNMARNIDAMSDLFVKENNIMLEQVKLGTVKVDEYYAWLESRMQYYQSERDKSLMEGYNLIDFELQNMQVTDEQKEEFRTMWGELFDFASELMPPEEAKKISDAIGQALQKQLDAIDKEYTGKINELNAKLQADTTAWMKGKSETGIFFHNYFGESPTKQFNDAMEYAQNMYKILYDEYNAELELIRAKMELLDENSEAYKNYAAQVEQIEADLATAEADYQSAQIDNIKEYGQRVTEIAGQFGDAIGGLASAMGSYYAEQAEQAKEMYGENSVEYQKYLKKEGNMKIAQVWTDFATGVMTAWATSEQLGPIAGPIMAAIQTAALLATAVASTQQIKRQTQASNNGGGSTANVGQLTDRVIMADTQRADQTAELNAKYNQGATRVYVTATDISDKQGENKTAVTNNRF